MKRILLLLLALGLPVAGMAGVTANVLVVAGGGSGGSGGGCGDAGGGGAGGITLVAQTLSDGGIYAVTIGAGGVGPVSSTCSTNDGGYSYFNNITMTGGGGGGPAAVGGDSGGSGGGAGCCNASSGLGISGYGFNGGNTNDSPALTAAGGGGGATQQGFSCTSVSTTGASGGSGLITSVGGSSYDYSDGGGGAVYSDSSIGMGGGAHGGSGGSGGFAVIAATSATGYGSGGGGGGVGGSGGNGYQGIVIVSFPTSYGGDGSATGTYTLAHSGGNSIYTFTGNGTFTAPYAYCATINSPIAEYQFACGNITADSSGNGNTLTEVGTVPCVTTPVVPGYPNAVGPFSTSNYFVPNNNTYVEGQTSFSKTYWFYNSNNTTHQNIYEEADVAYTKYVNIYVLSGNFGMVTESHSAVLAMPAADNRWHLLVVSYNAGEVTLYCDNTFASGSAPVSSFTPYYVSIGLDVASLASPILTYLGPSSDYNCALTPNEVADLYATGMTPITAPDNILDLRGPGI